MLKLVTESDESPTCRNCGAHVSEDFRRVFGDEDHVAHRCPECDTTRRLSRGSAAGVEVAVTDPEESAAHRSNEQAEGWSV
ncbi:hypothetical protein AArcSt11_08060 [Natranaeroarchaeum aerophilus]|uniref:Small CPxCG-related zinc finger protein n=1 Tax=Natranaeroarchaeum aerophilus TaxID=2917711 RepID=A0AAE3FR38_9EURY|nr:hypothetical protein [Natranaeroarchaeum aerophilus]MCL9813606.1 hypothetical protein [Natranaeroarchaeum aerophilus]